MSKEVVFTVSPDGQSIKVVAEGFQGQGCLETIKKYTRNLGTKMDEGATPEFSQSQGGGVRVGN